MKLQTYFWYLHNYNFSGEKQMVWPLWQEERVHCVLLKVLPPVELEEEPVYPTAGIPRPVCPGVCEVTGGTLPTNSAPSNPPGCVHWELVSCEYFLCILIFVSTTLSQSHSLTAVFIPKITPKNGLGLALGELFFKFLTKIFGYTV